MVTNRKLNQCETRTQIGKPRSTALTMISPKAREAIIGLSESVPCLLGRGRGRSPASISKGLPDVPLSANHVPLFVVRLVRRGNPRVADGNRTRGVGRSADAGHRRTGDTAPLRPRH